jgi:hypothetical protein
MRQCVFCQTTLTNANRSKEHVIPQWLQRARNLSTEMLSTGFADSNAVNIKRRIGLDNFLAGKVCSNCNNGWMSQLEVENMTLLLDIIDNKMTLGILSDDQRLSLAKWALKTCIACDSCIGEPPEIDRGLICQFDKGRSGNLGRCGVFAGRLSITSRFGYIRKAHYNQMILDANKQDVGSTIGLYIDGLVLITSFVDRDLSYVFEIVDGAHEPLWPNRGHELKSVNLQFVGRGQDLITLIDAIDVRYRVQVKD